MPDEKSGGDPPSESPNNPAPINQSPMTSSGTTNAQQEIEATKDLAKDVHWITHATFWSQVGLGIIGLIALWIYHGQLVAMQGQLAEMKRSGEQSTQQMWSAIEGIRWMAQSADLAQKDTHQSVEVSERQSSAALNVSIQALHFAERPYVTVESVRFDPPIAENKDTSVIKFDFHNAGRTPALKAVYAHDVFLNDVKLGEIPPDFPEETILGTDRSASDQVTITWAPGVQESIVAGTSRLELKGSITYTDLFKEWHTSTFCAAYRVKPNPVWIYCPGNDVK